MAEGLAGVLVASALYLVIAGVLSAIVLGGASTAAKKEKKKWCKAGAVIVGGSLTFAGAVGFALGASTGDGGGGGGGCPPGYILVGSNCEKIGAVTWTWQVPGTEAATNHDVETEFPDSPFVAGDAGTPDLNMNACTWDTNSFWYAAQSKAETIITVDDDSDLTQDAPTTADYQDPDMCILDVILQPGFVDLDGNGLMDDVPYYVRLRQVSPSTKMQGSASNSTQGDENIWYHDTVAGWYVGIGLEVDGASWSHENADHAYRSFCAPGDPGYSTASLNSDCYSRWIPAGLYDDGDPDSLAIWWASDNNGLFGYNAIDYSMSFVLTIDIGVPQSYFTITWEISVGVVD